MGVLIGIVWFVTGMHWAFALGYMLMGIIADFVAGAGQYKAKNSISFPTSCSPSVEQARISCSLQTRMDGRKQC